MAAAVLCCAMQWLRAPLRGSFLQEHLSRDLSSKQAWSNKARGTEAFLTLSVLALWERNKWGFGTSSTNVYLHVQTIGRVLTSAEWELTAAILLVREELGHAGEAAPINSANTQSSAFAVLPPTFATVQPVGPAGCLKMLLRLSSSTTAPLSQGSALSVAALSALGLLLGQVLGILLLGSSACRGGGGWPLWLGYCWPRLPQVPPFSPFLLPDGQYV